MDVHAALADRRRYERQVERLHQRYLLSSRLYADGETERLAAVALVAAVCAGALSWLRRAARARSAPGTALTPEWLHRLGQVRRPVSLGSARVVSAGGPERLDARTRDDRNRWRLAQLAERTARRVGRAGAAAWIGPDRIVWFEPSCATPRVTADWLQRASGGLIGEIAQRQCATGRKRCSRPAGAGSSATRARTC